MRSIQMSMLKCPERRPKHVRDGTGESVPKIEEVTFDAEDITRVPHNDSAIDRHDFDTSHYRNPVPNERRWCETQAAAASLERFGKGGQSGSITDYRD